MKLAGYSKNALLAVAMIMAVLIAGPVTRAADDNYAEGSFDRTLKVSGAVDLTISTGSGSISVRTGDASSVHVNAKIRVSEGWHITEAEAKDKVSKLEANPPIEQDGNSIRIGEIRDEDLRRNVSISYEVVTPADSRLHSSTGSGSQTLDGVRGPVDATTGSGSLHITHIGADLHATTGSGSVTLDDIKGNVRTTTGSGGIRATGIAGGLSAVTGSGTVELEQTAAGDVDVQTGSGSITLRGVHGKVSARAGSGHISADGIPTGEWRLHTGSGGVTLHLPADTGFELEANTGSGTISTTHELTVTGIVGSRHELHGKAHGGGPLISASTASGSIRVE